MWPQQQQQQQQQRGLVVVAPPEGRSLSPPGVAACKQVRHAEPSGGWRGGGVSGGQAGVEGINTR